MDEATLAVEPVAAAAERGDNQRIVATAGERGDNQRTVSAAGGWPGAVEGPVASPREATLVGRGTQTPVGWPAAGPAEAGAHAARSDSDPRVITSGPQLPEPWQHMAEHPGHGYVRTAGGHL